MQTRRASHLNISSCKTRAGSATRLSFSPKNCPIKRIKANVKRHHARARSCQHSAEHLCGRYNSSSAFKARNRNSAIRTGPPPACSSAKRCRSSSGTLEPFIVLDHKKHKSGGYVFEGKGGLQRAWRCNGRVGLAALFQEAVLIGQYRMCR
jgi:hypothetical protein